MTTDTAKPVGTIIQEMKASSVAKPTTEQPQSKSRSDKQSSTRKRNWLDKWLRLRPTHHSLRILEDKIYDFCSEYSKNPKHGRRIVIFGENGSGKTHTVRAVNNWANRIAMSIPLVDAEEGMRLADCVRVNWATVVDGFKNNQWELDELFNASLLIIDDIGAEHDPSKVGIEKLYLLLEKREHKWTMVTTNISPSNWESKFERRIADRLFRNFEHVDLTDTPSYSPKSK